VRQDAEFRPIDPKLIYKYSAEHKDHPIGYVEDGYQRNLSTAPSLPNGLMGSSRQIMGGSGVGMMGSGGMMMMSGAGGTGVLGGGEAGLGNGMSRNEVNGMSRNEGNGTGGYFTGPPQPVAPEETETPFLLGSPASNHYEHYEGGLNFHGGGDWNGM
jgi:hypothetical protein